MPVFTFARPREPFSENTKMLNDWLIRIRESLRFSLSRSRRRAIHRTGTRQLMSEGLEDRTLLAAQFAQITALPASITTGQTVEAQVTYTTTANNDGTGGNTNDKANFVGLQIYWNNNELVLSPATMTDFNPSTFEDGTASHTDWTLNGLNQGTTTTPKTAAELQASTDDADRDGNPNTTHFLTFSFVGTAPTFPGFPFNDHTAGADLISLEFTPASGFTGNSTVYSEVEQPASGNAAGTSTPVIVNVAAAPVKEVNITESGGTTSVNEVTPGNTDAFDVVLGDQPDGDVTIALSSNNAGATLSTDTLTFTTANWNVAQTVTVTGQDDGVHPGNRTATITLDPASTADTTYNGLANSTVSVTVVDDGLPAAGISTSGGPFSVNETGTTDTISVVLTAAPTADVTVTPTSGDTDEATVSGALTFTPGNWNVAQDVTVTGVDDTILDTDQTTTITLTATSTDTNYDGETSTADVTTVSIPQVNIDSVTLNPTTIPEGSQATGTISFTTNQSGAHDVVVDWGDGSAQETFTFPAGTTSDSVDHTFGNDVGQGDISVTVTSVDSGTATDMVTATPNVVNAPPTASAFTISNILINSPTVTDTITVSDPGGDTLTATIDWGQGAGPVNAPISGGTISLSNDFGPTSGLTLGDTFDIALVVTDDGSASDTINATLTVTDIVAEITSITVSPNPVNEGDSADVTVIFTTDLTASTHTVEFDFNDDGTVDDTQTLAAGVFTATASNTFVDDTGATEIAVTVTAVDAPQPTDTERTGSDSHASFSVTNLDPTITDGVAGGFIRPSNPTVTESIAVSDAAGANDTLAATIDWGDGTGIETVTLSGNAASVSHTYTGAVDGDTFTQTLTVTDEDGGSTTQTATVSVRDFIPGIAGTAGGTLTLTDTSTDAQTFSVPHGLGNNASVAFGDWNGDGIADVIVGASPGRTPQVKVFDGTNGTELHSFLAYNSAFNGGVFVAAGDMNNDGRADIITGAGVGGSPHVRAFNAADGSYLYNAFPLGTAGTGGARVAAGDVNNDGVADIIVAGGAGSTPRVRVVDGSTGSSIHDFNAFNAGFLGGIYVAAGDVNGDGQVDIIASAGATGTAHVRAFDGSDLTRLANFFAIGTSYTGGIKVSSGDITGDGTDEILVTRQDGRGALQAFNRDGTPSSEDVSSFGAGNHAANPALPGNRTPRVSTPLVNQRTTVDTSFSYTFDANTFSDADGDTLTYSSSTLPGWLSFDAGTRTFSGTPTGTDLDTAVTVTVTADDGNGGTVTDDFSIANGGTPAPITITGADSGSAPWVEIQGVGRFLAFPESFTGGVNVSQTDVNGDGTNDLIAAAGPSGGPHVRVFDGTNGDRLLNFFAYSTAFTGGVFVAGGDVNNDGIGDIITGVGPGGGPHVKVFSGMDGNVIHSFFAFDVNLRDGVSVAAEDVNMDGNMDIVASAPGQTDKIFSGADLTELMRSLP